MADTPHYHGHRQRLRERLTRDPRSLADYELLELYLAQVLPRRDTKPLAKELLARLGSLKAVLDADETALAQVKGFGPALAASWTLLKELRARSAEDAAVKGQVLASPRAVAELAEARLAGLPHEEVWAALVDPKLRLVGFERVATGTVGMSETYPREIFRLALARQAHGVILVHNHASGDPEPSREDVQFTEQVLAAGQAVGVVVRDHVIVAANGYYSFRQAGIFKAMKD